MIFSVRRPQNFISHKIVTRHRLSCDNSQEKWKLNVCGCNIIYSADLMFSSSSSLELAAGIRARFYTNLRIILIPPRPTYIKELKKKKLNERLACVQTFPVSFVTWGEASCLVTVRRFLSPFGQFTSVTYPRRTERAGKASLSIFAWTTWPETLRPRGIMRPRD